MEAIIQSEIGTILGDESLVEYVAGMLSDAPTEAESSEAVVEFLSSASDPPLEEAEAAEAASKLFVALRGGGFGGSNDDDDAAVSAAASGGGGGANSPAEASGGGGATRLLTSKVKIGDSLGGSTSYGTPGDDGNFTSNGTHMGSNLVSMRDKGDPLEATSQRAARKQAQVNE